MTKDNKEKMVRTQMFLEERQKAWIEEYGQIRKWTNSQIVRDAIDAYMFDLNEYQNEQIRKN